MLVESLIKCKSQINVMDIGASCINETPVYKILIDEGLAHLNAFEGDERQIEKIKETYGDNATVFPHFISDGTVKTLYIASEITGMTSLLKPNTKALKFFNGFDYFGKVEKEEQVATTKLDDISDLNPIDFLKMDIQGSELDVLKNGIKTLQNCVAIQLEVSYICLYENQPTFGDIDVWMRKNGFVPHCFLDVKRWSISPTLNQNNFRRPFNQLLESDIVYIKDPLRLESFSDDQLKKLALISHFCFSSFDLCTHLLIELEARNVLRTQTHVQYQNIVL